MYKEIKQEVYKRLKMAETVPSRAARTIFRHRYKANTGRYYRITAIIYKGEFAVQFQNIDDFHKNEIIITNDCMIHTRETPDGDLVENIIEPTALKGSWESYKELMRLAYHRINNDSPYIGMSYYRHGSIDFAAMQTA